jgi:hypothetical protein
LAVLGEVGDLRKKERSLFLHYLDGGEKVITRLKSSRVLKSLSEKWLSRYETTDVDAKRLAVSEGRRSLDYRRFTKDVRVVTAYDFLERI